MGSLLLAASEDEETGVVLLREELERAGVFKGVDRILLGELLGEREAEGVEVVEGILDYLRAGGSAEKETLFGVLDCFWFPLLEGSLRAGVARFPGLK